MENNVKGLMTRRALQVGIQKQGPRFPIGARPRVVTAPAGVGVTEERIEAPPARIVADSFPMIYPLENIEVLSNVLQHGNIRPEALMESLRRTMVDQPYDLAPAAGSIASGSTVNVDSDFGTSYPAGEASFAAALIEYSMGDDDANIPITSKIYFASANCGGGAVVSKIPAIETPLISVRLKDRAKTGRFIQVLASTTNGGKTVPRVGVLRGATVRFCGTALTWILTLSASDGTYTLKTCYLEAVEARLAVTAGPIGLSATFLPLLATHKELFDLIDSLREEM